MKRDGFFQCYNYIFRKNDMTQFDKLVFCAILSLSKGGEEEVFISYEKLAEFTGIGRTKAYHAIKNLIEKKYIKYSEKQKRNSKSYQVVKKWAVHEMNKTSSPHEHQPFTTRTSPVHHMNSTNNTITNNTSLNTTPLPPVGGSVLKKKKKVVQEIELPDWLDKKAWAEWIQYRKEIKKKLVPSTIKAQLTFLAKDKANHVSVIQQSITNGWTGLHELKNNKNNKPSNVLPAEEGKYEHLS
jgi:hypothetical protein